MRHCISVLMAFHANVGDVFSLEKSLWKSGAKGQIIQELHLLALSMYAVPIGNSGEGYRRRSYGAVFFVFFNDDIKMIDQQHAVLASFVFIAVLLELLHVCRVAIKLKFVHLAYPLVLLLQGIVLTSHVTEYDPLMKKTHTLHGLLGFATFATMLIDRKYKYQIVAGLVSRWMLMTDGTWYIYSGFILFAPAGWPKWNRTSHDDVMRVTTYFCINLGVNMGIVIFIWLATAYYYGMFFKKRSGSTNSYHIQKDLENGQIDDDDEKTEFIAAN